MTTDKNKWKIIHRLNKILWHKNNKKKEEDCGPTHKDTNVRPYLGVQKVFLFGRL